MYSQPVAQKGGVGVQPLTSLPTTSFSNKNSVTTNFAGLVVQRDCGHSPNVFERVKPIFKKSVQAMEEDGH
jgi:hypothetical protein